MAFIKKNWIPSGGQSFWTIADQGVVSLGTFLTNIILARHLFPAEYGKFAIIFGLLLFCVNVHSSLIIYPLSLELASAVRDKGNLVGVAILLTAALFLPIAVAFGIGCWIFGLPGLALWMCAALLAWLFQETCRRCLMAEFFYARVIWGDAVSYLGQAGLIFYLSETGRISVESALLMIAASSALAGILQIIQIGAGRLTLGGAAATASSFWSLGKWSLSTNLIGILAAEAFLWSLAFFHGAGEVGKWQAALNILGVTHPVLLGINNLLIPAVARVDAEDNLPAAKKTAFSLGAKGMLLLLPYFVLLFVYPSGILRLFYGADSSYAALEFTVRLLAICYILEFLLIVSGGLLRGLRRIKSVFFGQAVGTLTAAVVGLPLVTLAGLNGAAVGSSITLFSRLITNLLILRRVKGGGSNSAVYRRLQNEDFANGTCL